MDTVPVPAAGASVALASLEAVPRAARSPAPRSGAPAVARFLVDVDAPCNLACTLCPRSSRGLAMEVGDAVSLAGRVVESIEADAPGRVEVAYYGGEPLLSAEALLCHSERIRAHCERRGLGHEALVVTNGTLLDGDAALALRRAGIARALVTLEAPPRRHDAYRRLRDGGPSFAAIVRNLRAARHVLAVTIRVPADSGMELAGLPELLRALERAELLAGPRAVEVFVGPDAPYARQVRQLWELGDRGARLPFSWAPDLSP